MNSSNEPQKEMNDAETWMWKRNMNTAAWNVRSLFWSGALKVPHNKLSKLHFDIAALQKTQMGSGIKKT